MQLILIEDVEGLGSEGDVVKVADGYGRNYLLPRGLALLATGASIKRLEERKRITDARQKRAEREARLLARQLQSVSCTIRAQADENDRLYGSVTERDIVKALEDQGVRVDRQQVVMDEHIKALGVYPISIKLTSDVVAEIRVWVIKE